MIVDGGTSSGSCFSREYLYNSPKRVKVATSCTCYTMNIPDGSESKNIYQNKNAACLASLCHHGFAIQNLLIYPRWGVL